MKILVTGKNGQLGSELVRAFRGVAEVAAFDRQTLDLADIGQLRSLIRAQAPDVIINAAAYTAVDRAETEQAAAHAINAQAPAVMAEEASALGAALIHYSTDYVFDGRKAGPYLETDPTDPQSVYGKTKLAGEQAIAAASDKFWIWRTSWVYGVHGGNFLKTMLRLASERTSLRVVADQFGAPTFARAIAEATRDALMAGGNAGTPARVADTAGIYHFTGGGRTNWHGYAQYVIERAAEAGQSLNIKAADIEAIPASAYPVPAPRPSNSCLSLEKFTQTFGLPIAAWQDDVDRCLAELLAHHDQA
ncbi:MAG: dTDP-4-dehydrorhamnose reductase [Herbaspirillum huttiense]|uniref:dTDP-4-dehydrorhamnose reductase n=1 Tax=Herbaspirillum huttiense TaxID=863372 RepID=UPI001AC5E46A|nr:dTDP-4-dehydrorhamnose reductase [Herbaspirillum huttiense]MBN9355060.1 dTDP-4-dehydrorhamnose reductase [Herbaspirillum huttiense]